MSSTTPFHPVIRQWFEETYGTPTEIQEEAWKAIGKGEHVLLSAPTGSGKTLAAFLSAINSLVSGEWPGGTVRILYISPLKALNNDIQKNLTAPLDALEKRFAREGLPFPRPTVAVRSGDTPPAERQRMLRRPPEILITTPESLNLLLTAPKGRLLLTGLGAVILDEIHALLPEKRGVHLISGVERLTLLSGEFQRIGLSATIRPLELAAEYLAGAERSGTGALIPRRVQVIHRPGRKAYDFRVEYPAVPEGAEMPKRGGPGCRRPSGRPSTPTIRRCSSPTPAGWWKKSPG